MFNYRESIAWDDIPRIDMEELASSVVERCRKGWRLLALFGVPSPQGTETVCILADASARLLDAMRGKPARRYSSMTPHCPQAHLFERELFETWGIEPVGHPWLKPVRYCPSAEGRRRYRAVRGSTFWPMSARVAAL